LGRNIELEVPCDVEFFFRDPHGKEALAVDCVLNAKGIKVYKEAAGKEGNFLKSRAGALRDLPIDQSDMGAPRMGDLKQVVPEIAFTEDQMGGTDPMKGASDDPGKIEREKKMGVRLGHTAFGFGVSRLCRGGDDNMGAGVLLTDLVEKRDDRARLPHRNGMDPDHFSPLLWRKRREGPSESGRERLSVFAQNKPLPQEFGKGKKGKYAQKKVVH